MVIYELRIDNFKQGGWTEIFYLVPALGFPEVVIGSSGRLEMYKRRDDGDLERITGVIERGWNLSQGGRVNMRTLTDEETEHVLRLIPKSSGPDVPL